MRTAVYTGTRNVYGHMAAACKSLISHHGADHVYFLIEDGEFPEKLPWMVRCMDVSAQKYFAPEGPNFRRFWTYMALMKITAPLMFSGKILVLDIDTVVDGSLDGLWSLPPAPICMAREVGRTEEYYNAGVMLMDAELIRRDAKEIIRRLNTKPYQFCEQDAINEVMRGRIATLPPGYNASGWTVKPEGAPIITHYAAVRRWEMEPLWQKYAGMSWEEALERGGWGKS